MILYIVLYVMKAYHLSCLVILLSWSCQSAEEIPDMGLDYQPLAIGYTWTYQVAEQIVFGENDIEEDAFYFKDSIAHRYLAEDGKPVYIVERKKAQDRQNWKVDSQYTLQLDGQRLLRRVKNEIELPLIFPPKESRTWDGNLFNVRQPDQFTMHFKTNYTVGQFNFTKALLILRDQFDDFVTTRDNRFEVYAQNVGMVESFYEVKTYCSRQDCLGEQRIDSGRLTHIKLLSYEKN